MLCSAEYHCLVECIREISPWPCAFVRIDRVRFGENGREGPQIPYMYAQSDKRFWVQANISITAVAIKVEEPFEGPTWGNITY